MVTDLSSMSVFATNELAPAERADAWRQHLGSSFVPIDVSVPEDAQFHGVFRGTALGPILLCDVTASAHLATRSRRLIRRNDTEYLKLSMPVRGYCLLSQDDREAPLTPGDLCVYDTNRPYTLAFDDTCQLLVLMFPRRSLHLGDRAMREVTAHRVSGRRGVGALVSPLLMSLARQLDDADGAPTAPRLADNILDLLGTMFADSLGVTEQETPTSTRTLLLRVKRFIETHLDDVELSPATIADASHISTGYLHRLFRMEGTTVSGYVRQRRLEHCRRDLTDPAQGRLPVSAVGAHWGLVDAAHFSRLFKAEYGMSPREYRLTRGADGRIAVCGATDEGD
jgi:AraC-like DNA-binding protein